MHEQTGFLLTRQWRDLPSGIELSYWFSTATGPLHVVIEKQSAVCFIRRDNHIKLPSRIVRKPRALQALDNTPVDALYFQQQRDLSQLREHLAYDKSQLFESEIKPTERYLMERFITASAIIQGKITEKKGYRECRNPVLKAANYTPVLRWLSVDIETSDLRGKLYSIAVSSAQQEQVFMVKASPPAGNKNKVPIIWCQSEKEALQRFFDWLNAYDPDVIIGWNVVAFDLDFLLWKCRQLHLPFNIGRGKEAATLLMPRQKGQLPLARIPGRVVLDGITSLRGAFWSFESFTLEHVARQLLGKGKRIHHVQAAGKLEEIRRQYQSDPEALADYNLEDCRLVAAIFETTHLLDFSVQRAQMTGLAIDRQGGSTAAFDHLYLPRLHRQGYVAPDIGSSDNLKHSPGGWVMESQPGLYENVLVLDFKSLYPSIIRTFKIDPLGLVKGMQEKDSIPGFLAARFSRKVHILPDIVTDLWQQRDQAKQARNLPLSQAIKIIMNSFYGVLGSFGCRFFNPQLASSITLRGHEVIQTSRDLIEEQGYQVIYGDTDSVFVLVGSGKSEQDCQQIGRTLQNHLNRWWEQHLQKNYGLDSCLEIEFETHYIRFLMPTVRGAEKGSKKRYAGMVRQQGKEKMVFKGLETVRTDWTPLARDFQQELYRRIFTRQPYKAFIITTHDRLLKGELDHKLVYSKRLRRPLESYTSTQPPQVKAARKMHNPGRKISYIITTNGPEPTENATSSHQSPPDYQHYSDKQLAPVADSILYFLDTCFERITQRQLDVFDNLMR